MCYKCLVLINFINKTYISCFRIKILRTMTTKSQLIYTTSNETNSCQYSSRKKIVTFPTWPTINPYNQLKLFNTPGVWLHERAGPEMHILPLQEPEHKAIRGIFIIQITTNDGNTALCRAEGVNLDSRHVVEALTDTCQLAQSQKEGDRQCKV